MKNVLGAEIGGTKLQVTLADIETLEPVASLREQIVPAKGAAGIRAQLEAAIHSLLTLHKAEALGIGFGGPLDVKTGIIAKSHQVEGWDQFPLAHWCREQFDLPTTIRNDCDTAALAEATLGAGRNHQSCFYVTVGSGIGGGYVCDGKLQGETRPAFGEIGHLRPGIDATDIHQTVESITSGFGIADQVRAVFTSAPSADQEDLLARCEGNLPQLTTRKIAAAALAGNTTAQRAIHHATQTLGWAIAQAVTLLAPQRVIVGGGVSLMPEELFMEPLRKQVAAYVFPPLAESYEIVPAALGEAVVVKGALLLARQSLA